MEMDSVGTTIFPDEVHWTPTELRSENTMRGASTRMVGLVHREENNVYDVPELLDVIT
jgi:hypothetical protein